MKNNNRLCFVNLVLLIFAAFSLISCRDLFHTDPGGLGTLKIENTSDDVYHIKKIYIRRWGSLKTIASDNNDIYPRGSRDFPLGAGDYQVYINDSYGRKKVGSVKITIKKDETKVVQYNVYTGVYTYP